MKLFYLNRSDILKDKLLDKKFKFEKKNNKLDFSYDCEDKTKSFIRVIPKSITNKLDNKKTLYIESIKDKISIIYTKNDKEYLFNKINILF